MSAAAQSTYVQRHPGLSVVYQVVRDHLDAFRAKLAESDRELPGFVVAELRRAQSCGDLRRGFLRMRCQACGEPRLIPYSCKTRGPCASCAARRMSDTAAHLVDRVIGSKVPVRQWVLALPFWLHAKVAFKPALCSALLGLFIDAVRAWLVSAARDDGIDAGQIGAVTSIQRGADAMRLMPHYHSLFADGVFYRKSPDDPPCFHRTRAPTDLDVAEIVTTVAVRADRLLRRFGVSQNGVDEDEPDPGDVEALLPALAQAPTCARQGATAAARRVTALPARARPRATRCAAMDGFDLHANITAGPQERGSLERLAKYILRPPVPETRLRLREDGCVEMTLRRPARDGATAVVFRPHDFLARLCAILPPPRFNEVRYHGVYSSHAAWRRDVIPAGRPGQNDACETPNPGLALAPSVPKVTVKPSTRLALRPRRLTHQQLLARVWAADVSACPKCGGHMVVVATIMNATVIEAIAACIGVADDTEPPRARGPPRGPLFAPELIKVALRLSAA